jgi:hypothetical protein
VLEDGGGEALLEEKIGKPLPVFKYQPSLQGIQQLWKE